MRTRFRSILVVAIILVIVIALIIVEIRLYGTGFAGKTLFDWLTLLGILAVPVVVGFGAVWFTTRQGKVADAVNKDNQRENGCHPECCVMM
jgi:ABC-type molybdate transport system permease subunit